MYLKIRCDGESEKFYKIFWELNKARKSIDVPFGKNQRAAKARPRGKIKRFAQSCRSRPLAATKRIWQAEPPQAPPSYHSRYRSCLVASHNLPHFILGKFVQSGKYLVHN